MSPARSQDAADFDPQDLIAQHQVGIWRYLRVLGCDAVLAADLTWDRWAGQDNGDQLLENLRDCLKLLSERARGALEMRFRQRLRRLEIARSLEITEHGAKNLMQRAKKQLRQCVEGKMQ